LLQIKGTPDALNSLSGMTPFLFRCPITGKMVQALHADDESLGDGGEDYISVECLACGRVHLVNPATGKVAGQ
jgi:hypothetical protein